LEGEADLTRTIGKGSTSTESSSIVEKDFASTNAKWERFRQSRLNVRIAPTERRDDDANANAATVPDDPGTREALPTRNEKRSPRRNARKKISKSVSFRDMPEYYTAKESPLTVIDEVVEADFDRSEPIDLDRVKSFRDRLRRIQEKKNSRKPTLLDRTRALKCVFPASGSSAAFVGEGIHFWEDGIITNHLHTNAMHREVERDIAGCEI
jgi:hypothetical protein